MLNALIGVARTAIGLSLASCQLIRTAITAGTSRVTHGPLCLHAVISLFEACSAFTLVTACTLAESPCDPLHQRLQQSRCLHCCSDCYRVERTSSRAGIPPLWASAFHGAPGNPTYRPLGAKGSRY
jgi:hypothetical protein